MIAPQPSPEDYAGIVVPLPDFIPASGGSADAAQVEQFQSRQKLVEPRPVRRHPFEFYVVGQPSAGAWPTVKCAWGTVCKPHTATGYTNIAARTNTFTLAEDNLFFIETAFTQEGNIVTCTLKQNTTPTPWAEYPKQFSSDGLTWYHPIAHVRVSTTNPPESGEISIDPTGGMVVLAQLTTTHLRIARACGMDEAMTIHWKLEPGPGAVI